MSRPSEPAPSCDSSEDFPDTDLDSSSPLFRICWSDAVIDFEGDLELDFDGLDFDVDY